MMTIDRQLRDFVSYDEKQKLSRWQVVVLAAVRERGRAATREMFGMDDVTLRMVLMRIRRKGIREA